MADQEILLLGFPGPRQQLKQVDPVLVKNIFGDIVQRQQAIETPLVGIVGNPREDQSNGIKPIRPKIPVFINIQSAAGVSLHYLMVDSCVGITTASTDRHSNA
ncbi:hypothetical protein PM076_04505 [Halorubrum ezzemoulense]|uniref:Uncharacterized protein n=1 Tax=Halorubrum ezzemoulense TaxID=337243 RepID=A0ABT4YYV2_HALEZ|nr:hypothetical protein [Halorubrum ezzemoulense]MDB2245689.1 hypothetical protein [Halorubrum ezzemoulense]MDB2278933.1 hypothetical protein [Halorubrum ezzemoulense]MDB2287645.1 hypothetical protein [Halorubrum ezzemoulense]MDB2291092.1 hypothetical protein [Halorubrum ezzemoulense]MDB2295567.1 hypothetical protein [Halorubrum ezzemoulense]